jgi:hypothetical protein
LRTTDALGASSRKGPVHDQADCELAADAQPDAPDSKNDGARLPAEAVTVRGRSSGGQTSVEFALAGVVVLVLFFGVIEVSRLIFGLNSITTAAREAGRYGIASANVAAAQAQNSSLQTACETTTTTQD